MLQQTQVDRVIPKYKKFLRRFPSIASLARAPLGSVLKEWQGLGYNRRAKYLHQAAKEITNRKGTKFPHSHSELLELPGIGEYTASALRAFAWNEPDVFIETNIRTVFIHHFFLGKRKVRDSEIRKLIQATLDPKNVREWYYALMDYGASLKKTVGNASRKSAHHIRQKPFKGSDREVRGAILRLLSETTVTMQRLQKLPFTKEMIQKQSAKLIAEGLIIFRKKRFSLPL